MIEAGCLENPHVEHCLGLHVRPTLQVGEIGFHYGKCHAASDTLTIKVQGKQAHGAYPQDGIDAIVIASNIILALQTIVSRNLSPFNSAVISLGMIEGGSAGNIVCNDVTIRGTLRTLDLETRTFMKNELWKSLKVQVKLMGGTPSLKLKKGMRH